MIVPSVQNRVRLREFLIEAEACAVGIVGGVLAPSAHSISVERSDLVALAAVVCAGAVLGAGTAALPTPRLLKRTLVFLG